MVDGKIRLLIVEDSADDAELILGTLKRAGLPVHSARVDSAKDLKIQLEDADWD